MWFTLHVPLMLLMSFLNVVHRLVFWGVSVFFFVCPVFLCAPADWGDRLQCQTETLKRMERLSQLNPVGCSLTAQQEEEQPHDTAHQGWVLPKLRRKDTSLKFKVAGPSGQQVNSHVFMLCGCGKKPEGCSRQILTGLDLVLREDCIYLHFF